MASSEAEDLNEETSQPALVKSAATPHLPPDLVEKNRTQVRSQFCSPLICKHAAQPDELSVGTDFSYSASETHACSKRAYRSVPAATLTANHSTRLLGGCAIRANVLSNGHSRSGVTVFKNTQRPTVSNNPRTNWNLDLFKLRSGLLGKRAFSPQPAASGPYLTCPSLSKASSSGAPEPSQGAQSSMPTNQSSPWGSVSLKDHGKAATTKPTTITATGVKVPCRPCHGPRQGTRNPSKPAAPQLTQSYCQDGDRGDGKTQPRFSMPLQVRTVSKDVSVDHLWRLKDTLKLENGVTAEVEGGKEQVLVCTSHGGEAGPAGGMRKVASEVAFTQAVRKLTHSTDSHDRNKSLVNGQAVHGDKSANAKATHLRPSCHRIPAKPSPVCLTSAAQQVSVELMETWESSTAGTCASPAFDPDVPTTQASAPPSATQESSDAGSGSPPKPSVGSVTTRISAIHLTREGCPSKSPNSSPTPSLEERLPTESDASGQESIAMLQDEDGDFHDDSSDADGSDCSSMNDSSSTASTSALSQ